MSTKEAVELGPLDRLSSFAYRRFGRQSERIASAMPWLKEEILKSNMRITPEADVALSILFTLLTGTGWVVSLLVLFFLTGPFLAELDLLFAVVPLLTFLLTLRAPRISQGARAASLDSELPFVIGFIVVLAGGGIPPVSSLRRIAGMRSVFPAAAKEANRILLDIDVFGMDPITALEKAAKYSPNKAFSEFLYGYTTVIKTGGNLSSYLAAKMKDIYDYQEQKIKQSSNTIGVLAEGYITITSVLGISLFVLYEVQAVVSQSSAGLQVLEAFGLLVIPALSVLFIFLLNSVQNKFPFVDYRAFKVFFYSVPIGVAFLLLPLPTTLFLHVSIALVLMVTAPSVVAFRIASERNELDSSLPDFIRDISEGRKIGMSPEAIIQALGDKKYGALSKHVKKMGSQLSWGISLAKVLSTFTAETASWMTRELGLLLVEVVEVGGGTVKSFMDMSEFTRKMNEMESEKRASLKPYIFITYFSAIMIVTTTITMVYFVSTPLNISIDSSSKFITASGTVDILLTIAVFESWVIGLVAGKMGEGSTADGFKHALILVLIAVFAVYVLQAVLHVRI